MTDSSTGGPRPGGWPFDPVSGGAASGHEQGPDTPPVPSPAPAWAPGGTPITGGARPAGVPPRPLVPPPPVVPPATPSRPTASPGPNRRRTLMIVGLVVGVLVLGGIVTAIVTTMNRSGSPLEAVTSTTRLPSPTPTIAPAAREKGSAFLAALPSSVLQYAWGSVAPDDTWRASGALEAYDVVYTDGGSGKVTVRAGQWRSAAEVATVRTALVADLTSKAATPTATPTASAAPTGSTGDVTVAGATVGTWTIVPGAGGSGTVVWSNGTTLFEATAPTAELANLYAAFPL